MNILNGGVHANRQGPDFQEYLIAPNGAPTFTEAVRRGSEIYHALKGLLREKGYSHRYRQRRRFCTHGLPEHRAARSDRGNDRAGRLRARKEDRDCPRPGVEQLLP
ncbi:hypothetical protein [Methanoculleus sp.]|nr:hypothetical protein [Methanoculleus sp.]